MKSRLLQGLALLVLFAIAVALFSGGSGQPTDGGAGSEYVPPAP